MADFSNVGKRKITRKDTIEATLPYEGKDGQPMIFIGRYAGEGNAGFMTAVNKVQHETDLTTEEGLEKWYESCRRLFLDYVLVGWKNVIDSNDKDVDFSREAAKDFLGEMDIADLLPVLAFFRNRQNFVRDKLSREEAQAVGNGSQKS